MVCLLGAANKLVLIGNVIKLEPIIDSVETLD